MIRGTICIVALLGLTACAEVNAAIETAARYKATANDTQARVWQLESCDLSLGGLDQLPVEMQVMLVRACTGLDMRPVQFVVGGGD